MTFTRAFQRVTQLSFTRSTHGLLVGNWKNVGSKILGADNLHDQGHRKAGDSRARRSLGAIRATIHQSLRALPFSAKLSASASVPPKTGTSPPQDAHFVKTWGTGCRSYLTRTLVTGHNVGLQKCLRRSLPSTINLY